MSVRAELRQMKRDDEPSESSISITVRLNKAREKKQA
jgi:hypothetical protein